MLKKLRWLYSRVLDRMPDCRLFELWCILTPQSWQDQNDGMEDNRNYFQRVSDQLYGPKPIAEQPLDDADYGKF